MNNRTHRVEPLILIVDDVVANVKLLHDAMEGLGKVIFATDGAQAVGLARDRAPDVILLDIAMPGMDGYAVCAAVKADPRCADAAVIFVTAHDSAAHELQSLSQGGVDFLQKPLNLPVVRARVRTQLELRARTKDLRTARAELADLVRLLPAFVSHWSADGLNHFSNDETGAWFGIPAAELRGRQLDSVLGEANTASLAAHLASPNGRQDWSCEIDLTAGARGRRHGHATVVTRSGDPAGGFLLLITDVTARKTAELSLFDEKERFKTTLNSIGDAVVASDAAGRVTFMNPIAEDMTGWRAHEAAGRAIEDIMPLCDGGTGHAAVNPLRLALQEERIVGMALNCVLRRRDGVDLCVEDSAAPIRDHGGAVRGAIIVFHDVSEARAMAIKMTHLAQHDALTNLPNRMQLQDRAALALQQARRNGQRVAMLLIDLDDFKHINDTLGHIVGDVILQRIARRLCGALRAADTVSRQGGDEFVVLLSEIDDIAYAGATAEKLLAVVAEPLDVDGHRFDLSASVGVSLFPDDSADQDELYRHADSAMYRAKQEGRKRYRFFSADIEERLLSRNALERSIRGALEHGRFEVFYQVKVDAGAARYAGMEALVRWRDDDGALRLPAGFIPVAEETGLIVAIDRFVLAQACRDGARLREAGHPTRVSVNISAKHFLDPHFIPAVTAALADSALPPALLELEITEGMLMHNVEHAQLLLGVLKAMGIAIAIDDFGTGYSSLSYLKKFPIDTLKIDQSFVRDMLTDRNDAAIIAAIISLASSLGLDIVAEGVESQQQASALLARGCHVLQGYLYSKPVSYAAVQALIMRGVAVPG
jgi:diguanylate cyclase (GGDEF)-like protein/PAS domain S-box-containing protein